MHFQISTFLTPELANDLADLFSDMGAEAVTLTDAKDEPLFQLMPDDEPLWQHTTVCALFDHHHDAKIILKEITEKHAEFQSFEFLVTEVPEKNWLAESQKQFQAQQFGSLWICPQWEADRFADAKDPIVFLAPGLAFGTGTHPTTQLCLQWLSDHPPCHLTVVDYGCGSGILALAAAALCATTVYATDHDPQALIATENNTAYNTLLKNKIVIRETHQMHNIKADLVVANILANPLIELAPTLMQLLKHNGILVLSGLLLEDVDRVFSAYQKDFKRFETQEKNGWALIAGRQNNV